MNENLLHREPTEVQYQKFERISAKTEDEKIFYEMLGDFLLQVKQREVLERKLF